MLKHHNHRKISHTLGGVFVFMSLVTAAISYAAVESSEDASSSVAMREALYKQLTAVQSQIVSEGADEATYLAAQKELQGFEKEHQGDSLTNYELAQLANLSGYINFLRSDYPSAVLDYRRVVELTDEVPALQSATLLTIAQLYFKLDEFEPSLEYVNQLIERAESQGQVPEESWLKLQKACLDQLNDSDDQVAAENDHEYRIYGDLSLDGNASQIFEVTVPGSSTANVKIAADVFLKITTPADLAADSTSIEVVRSFAGEEKVLKLIKSSGYSDRSWSLAICGEEIATASPAGSVSCVVGQSG